MTTTDAGTKFLIKSRLDLHKLLPKDFFAAELGVAEGLFSRDLLAMGAGRLYMVDSWRHRPGQFGDGASPRRWHLKNELHALQITDPWLTKRVILKMDTTEATAHVPDQHLDLVYIDACHTHDCVLEDLYFWWHKVKAGGVVAGHDYMNKTYGVFTAVAEFAKILGDQGTQLDVHVIPENGPDDASFYFFKP